MSGAAEGENGMAKIAARTSAGRFAATGIPYFGIGAAAFGAFAGCGLCRDNLAICLRAVEELEATTDEDIAAWRARAAAGAAA